ncbi:NAD(P)-binding protein, partial [Aureobasidium melanogenum]
MAASKVVILTGASRGIGLAIAHYLLKQKCRVVTVARSREPMDNLSKQYPGQVEVLAGDLSDLSLGQKAADLAKSKWQRLDSIIVNHGILDPVKRVANVEAEEWRQLFDVNVFSAIALVKASLPALRESKGSIILCSSGAATGNYATWGAYGASKAVLNHLAQTLAVEEPDVTTLSIRPGVVDTDMQVSIRNVHNTHMDVKDAAKFKELKETGGLLKPEQPGHVMAKLALDAPKDLNGKFLSWNDEKLAAFQE